MSKSKGEGEANWGAEMDKRIRNRRWLWTTPELEKLGQSLSKLPDLASEAQMIELEQPAIGPRPTDVEAEAGADSDPSGSDGNPS
jgi:hypothetical protein